MTKQIKVTEMMSTLHEYDNMGLDLWLTPGSSYPYWGSHASFMYDEKVATPQDFLEAAGYDVFDDKADYEEHDEAVTIKVEALPSVGKHGLTK